MEYSCEIPNFYRKAIALRKELSCVRHGSYQEFGKCSSKVYTYAREDEKQKILVVCSFSEKETKIRIPSGFDLNKAKLALCSTKNPGEKLKPYETRVYLWE